MSVFVCKWYLCGLHFTNLVVQKGGEKRELGVRGESEMNAMGSGVNASSKLRGTKRRRTWVCGGVFPSPPETPLPPERSLGGAIFFVL